MLARARLPGCLSTQALLNISGKRTKESRSPTSFALTVVGLQPTVIASRAPHLLLEQSVMIQRIVDVHRPSTLTGDARLEFLRA